MAPIICVECSSEVPDASEQCPECGFPFDSLKPVECPQCKNMVVFASDLCPACGFPYEKLEQDVADDSVVENIAVAASADSASADPESLELGAEDTINVELGAADLGTAELGTAELGTAELGTAELGTAEPGAADLGTVDLGAVRSESAETPFVENADSGAAQDLAEQSSDPSLQPEQYSISESDLASLCNNPIDNDYVIYAIKKYISEVKTDLVNKPIKAFIQILTELDNSNTELYKTVVKLGADTLDGVQEASHANAGEISKIIEQHNLEALSKSQELTLTVVSEINAATAVLKEAQGALAADLSNSIKEISAQIAQPAPTQAAPPAQPAVNPESAPASNDMSEYIFYLCLGMLVFTIANLFITIYAVKLMK